MSNKIMYECGCAAGGDFIASFCPIHGDPIAVLNKDDLSTKELTEIVDALGSAVKAQQPLNQAVHDRLTAIETVVTRIGDTQVKILDILAGKHR